MACIVSFSIPIWFNFLKTALIAYWTMQRMEAGFVTKLSDDLITVTDGRRNSRKAHQVVLIEAIANDKNRMTMAVNEEGAARFRLGGSVVDDR